MGVELEQLVTDGQWLCGRGTQGQVSCTGHPNTARLGDLLTPKPVDVTALFRPGR